MMLQFGNVNWWGVILAAIAQLAVGAVWNGMLFGERFYAAQQVRERPKFNPGQGSVMVLLTLLNAYLLSVIFHTIGVDSAGSGMMLMLVLWISLLAPFIIGTGFGTGRTRTIPLDLGHTLIGLVLVGLILGALR